MKVEELFDSLPGSYHESNDDEDFSEDDKSRVKDAKFWKGIEASVLELKRTGSNIVRYF